MSYDFALAWKILPELLQGTLVTLAVVVLPVIFGMLISVPITLARLSSNRVLVGAAWSFTTVFRGAPALVVVYMVYNGVATLSIVRDTFLWNIFSDAYFCAVIGLTLNHAGFLTEVIRGALQAVPRDVIEAARSMGLTRRLVFVKITAPLAVRYGLSAYLNEIILFVKGTAVVSAITVTDLLAVANETVSNTYDLITPLVSAAFIYWLLVQILRSIFVRLERHLTRHLNLEGAKSDNRESSIGKSL